MPYTPKASDYTDAFMYQNPANSGIGNFMGNMDKWKDMSTGQFLTPDQIKNIQGNNTNGVDMSKAWMDNGNLQGGENQKLYDAMKSYTYRHGGENYMIGGNYYHGGGGDQEGANTAGDLAFGGIGALGHPDQGRQLGEMGYGTTEFRPGWGGDMGDYNGKNFDFYDNKGKFVGGQAPMGLGDDAFTRQAIMSALMVLGPMAGVAAVGGTAALGAGVSPVLAAEGLGAAGLGSAGTIGLGGVAGVGTGAAAGAAGGSGAFLGEGVQSGIPAWDGAAGGLSGGFGTTPLVGVGAPTAPGIGAPAAGGAGGSSGGLTGALSKPLFEIPGIGGVSSSNLLGLGSTLLGGLSGGQGQSASTTSTKELPDYLQGPVAGQGGLIDRVNMLMGQQMGGSGLLDTPSPKKKKKKPATGLL